MKIFILSSFLCLGILSTTTASSDPIVSLKVISNSKVEFELNDISQIGMFEDAVYFPQANVIKFETRSKIRFIQVFNSQGVMQYQLPVRSKNVKISKSLFSKGEYRLGFMIENEDEILFTNLTVN
ncbi:MAG: hypothetical protein HKO66_08575 [Saprospiraceae bacterium]|nr:hypothetical protein [Bacteroidia bacterium]NNE15415.1 hypothetical protein [Saprospiraceae bacterium]NNL92271.1 hypothetical protein [Saprospiraceae bacterium]